MWTCGRGEYGLCGNGGTEDQLLPAPLEAFEEHIIVDVQVSKKRRVPCRSIQVELEGRIEWCMEVEIKACFSPAFFRSTAS